MSWKTINSLALPNLRSSWSPFADGRCQMDRTTVEALQAETGQPVLVQCLVVGPGAPSRVPEVEERFFLCSVFGQDRGLRVIRGEAPKDVVSVDTQIEIPASAARSLVAPSAPFDDLV